MRKVGVSMSYIKGTFIKEIYSNKENGYIVGVLKLKETDLEISTSNVYFTGNESVSSDLELPVNLTPYNKYVSYSKYYQYWLSLQSNGWCSMTADRLSSPGSATGSEGSASLYSLKHQENFSTKNQALRFYKRTNTSEAEAIWGYLKYRGYVKN